MVCTVGVKKKFKADDKVFHVGSDISLGYLNRHKEPCSLMSEIHDILDNALVVSSEDEFLYIPFSSITEVNYVYYD